ncbi:ankyrin repeat domain-containing protein [Lutispora thermophila]|nr:ankyrin repeat domain-containing protein [Lutispora thermophila]
MLNKGFKALVAIVLLAAVIIFLSFDSSISSAEPKAVDVLKQQDDVTIKTDDEKRENHMEITVDKLTQAVLENDITSVKSIITSGIVDINSEDSEGEYPIETVLVMGNCDMAKILLEAGANPYVMTSSGKSVYDLVMEGDNTYLKKIFEQYAE